MNLLGFDTSTAATAVAVVRADGEVFEVTPPAARLAGRPGHAAELMPAVHDAMRRARLGFADLDAVAVGLGPGTFTGLRIGVATARALAKASRLPLRGVSSLAALAHPMPGRLRLPLVDARRGELYAALLDGGAYLWEPFAAPPGALVARLAEAPGSPLAAGDGSLRFRHELEAAGVAVAPAESNLHVVSAVSVCELAAAVPDRPPEHVLPHYLREPDATPR